MKYVVFLVVKALLVLNQSVVGLKPTVSYSPRNQNFIAKRIIKALFLIIFSLVDL